MVKNNKRRVNKEHLEIENISKKKEDSVELYSRKKEAVEALEEAASDGLQAFLYAMADSLTTITVGGKPRKKGRKNREE